MPMEPLRPRQQHCLKGDTSQQPGKRLQQRSSTAAISPLAAIPQRVALGATVSPTGLAKPRREASMALGT